MTIIATCTAFVVVGSQLVLTAYMKRRGFKDVECGEEASKVGSPFISFMHIMYQNIYVCDLDSF
jgi:hypothetical protein